LNHSANHLPEQTNGAFKICSTLFKTDENNDFIHFEGSFGPVVQADNQWEIEAPQPDGEGFPFGSDWLQEAIRSNV